MAKKYKLITPREYEKLDKRELELICNGCGTEGWKGKLVPDTIYGVNITKACNIHDFMYFNGMTMKDKKEADDVFLKNLLTIVNHSPKWSSWLNRWRRKRARKYYLAVKHFGKKAYMAGKHGFKNYTHE